MTGYEVGGIGKFDRDSLLHLGVHGVSPKTSKARAYNNTGHSVSQLYTGASILTNDFVGDLADLGNFSRLPYLTKFLQDRWFSN